MTVFEMLKEGAEKGYQELMTSLEGVTEEQAWAVLPNQGPDYLHSGGSIYSVTMHVASLKWVYGSICFRNTEIRWRDAADQIEAFEPSWTAALDYLERGHQYWMESWAGLADFEEMRPTNWKSGDWPAWKIIQFCSQHDAYHAGQIAVFRYGCAPSDVRPASEAEEIRKYCRDSIHW
ncbi:DinB family protein [bacterium]|nr:MAG: DinB family protein [bacterium]